MSVTITLPPDIEALLRRASSLRDRPAEDLAIDILRAALSDDRVSAPEEVVARIRALPRNPANIREPEGSLAEVLGDDQPGVFDLASWQAEWARVEAEMKAIELADEWSDRQH